MQLPVNFKARWYQADFLKAMDSGAKLAILCWARRAGKDFTCFGLAVKKMVETPMNVVLVFPTKEQGKNSFWENVENDGFKTIDHIPASLIARKDNSNMRIVLKNGSTFQIMGATEADALRGANAKLYIFSEFVDIDSAAYDVVVPVVEVNGGQIIIQSTPKIDGISGGTFKMMFDDAIKEMEEKGDQSREYASMITAHEYLSDESLERLRLKAIKKHGNDFFFRQEFLCDWGQASSTSYYGAVLQLIKERGQIDAVPYEPKYPVYTAWDLGMSDSTAITFFQYYGKRAYVIDYYESHDIGNAAHIEFLKTKPYNYMWHFFPHDAKVRDSDAVERIEKIREYGLLNSSILRREPVEDGIKRVVENLPDTFMDAIRTEDQRRKLILYKRKFNPYTGDYLGPEHKTESHAADSIRYMFTAIEQDFNKETGEFLYSPDNQQQTYATDTISMPAQYRG
jgi:phage terminase large subunit